MERSGEEWSRIERSGEEGSEVVRSGVNTARARRE